MQSAGGPAEGKRGGQVNFHEVLRGRILGHQMNSKLANLVNTAL
jgi:hypothetical protein